MKLFFKNNESPDFYYMLKEQCDYSLEAINALTSFVIDLDEDMANRIESIEKKADQTRKDLVSYVESSFITPLDRHDISSMSRCIDDLTDKIKDLKDFILFFNYHASETQVEMCRHIKSGIDGLSRAVDGWYKSIKTDLWEYLVVSKRSENEVKRLYWKGILDLKENDKELYDVILSREFSKDLNSLANKIGKAADRIGDIKIKSIK